MAQGNYDHPSYLTRVLFGLGLTTAGANGTSGGRSLVSDMRFRKMSALIKTAGTTAGNNAILFCIGQIVTGYNLSPPALTTSTSGTNTIGSMILTTSTANAVLTSTDMNTRVLAGAAVFLKNGTDATGVCVVDLEASIDPSGTWT